MQNKPVYFISDAHLGVDPAGAIPHREELLVNFLKSLKGASSILFIVGDLFEFWYEYRYYIVRGHFPLFRALADLVDSGTEVHYLAGNHDFALSDFFPKELGVAVHKTYVCEVQGRRIFLMHGDGIPKSDSGYRFARHIIDAPWARSLFRKIHPDLGMKIARSVGRNSRKLGESRPIIIEEYLAAASRKMRENNCDLCVHGHHHLSGLWKVPEGEVASPGQWLFRLEYAKLEEGKIFIKSLQDLP
ncbi:MAG: UDP-2,3-diacylglucosamine diphosphatase [Fibrobacteraceae bacterium]|nr:UDP-2,3-diacylglucosamine diphosphatase [Fibrobacteraceae bacterium]